jgi:hypothetical protein
VSAIASKLGVVVANAIDRATVEKVFGRAGHDTDEGEPAEEVNRRQDNQHKDVEHAIRTRRLGDEPEDDQCARHRADKQHRSRRALADRGGPGALEGEVLGCQRGQQRLRIGRSIPRLAPDLWGFCRGVLIGRPHHRNASAWALAHCSNLRGGAPVSSWTVASTLESS